MVDPFKPSRWSLKDLLADSHGPQLQDYLSQLDETLGDLESARSRLSPDMPEAEFLDILKRYEVVSTVTRRLVAYAF